MCEINPKHTKIMRLEFFTSNPNASEQDFEQLVAEKALAMEMLGNMDGQLRVHVHEMDEPKKLPAYKEAKLRRLIKAHAEAQVALSWMGSKMPEEHEPIQKDAERAWDKLDEFIREGM